MKAGPCRIPSLPLDRQQLEFWNAAMSHAGTEISLSDAEIRFQFCPATAPGAKKGGFSVALPEGPVLLLAIERFDFEEWTGTELTYNEVHALPATMRKAMDRGILDLLLSQLPEEVAGRIGEIQALDPARLTREAKTRPLSWLEVSLTIEDSAPVAFLLGLRPEEFATILGKDNLELLMSHSEALAAVPIPLRYSLGTVELGLDEFSGLAQGDLILFESKSSRTVFYVTSPHARYGFTSQDSQWYCHEILPLQRTGQAGERTDGVEEVETGAETDDPFEEGGPGDVGAIPILLNFEVGRLTLPIGELAGWQPGTLVEIEPPRIDDGIEVVIRANGKWIGSGDLVRVGERLAVRIARLGSRGEAAGQEAGDES